MIEGVKVDLSPAKIEILEQLLLNEMPVKAAKIAKDLGKEAPATQMHLIGLVRMGLAVSPSKGQYVISTNGKQAVGLPEITKEKAHEILAHLPREKAFHFYEAIDKPLNVYANSLTDFYQKMGTVSINSVKFHFERGDFEAWFKSLGDLELAKKIALQKRTMLPKEELCNHILPMVKNRCIELSKKAGQSAPF